MQQGGNVSSTSGESKADPISEAQRLVPAMKQSLGDLVKVACETLIHRTSLDGSAEKMEGVNVIVSGQFDRQLEKFYSVCDKLQICLTTALDAVVQSQDSAEMYKMVDTCGSSETQLPRTHQTTLTYDQCLAAAERRSAEIKEMHDVLQEFTHSLET